MSQRVSGISLDNLGYSGFLRSADVLVPFSLAFMSLPSYVVYLAFFPDGFVLFPLPERIS